MTAPSSRTAPEPEGCVLVPPVLTGSLQPGLSGLSESSQTISPL